MRVTLAFNGLMSKAKFGDDPLIEIFFDKGTIRPAITTPQNYLEQGLTRCLKRLTNTDWMLLNDTHREKLVLY